MNGKPLNELSFEQLRNVNTIFVEGENTLHGLSIIARVEFNGTTVQCLVKWWLLRQGVTQYNGETLVYLVGVLAVQRFCWFRSTIKSC